MRIAERKWPDELDCAEFAAGPEGCISIPDAVLHTDWPVRTAKEVEQYLHNRRSGNRSVAVLPSPRPSQQPLQPPLPTASTGGGSGSGSGGSAPPARGSENAPSPMSLAAASAALCREKRQPSKYVFVNRTGRCAQLCNESVLFTPTQKHVANVWVAASAAIALFCSALALLTFAVSEPGVKFPQRPVFFIAFCNVLVGAAFGLRASVGRTSASCMHEPLTSAGIVAQEGVELLECSLVFMLSYFGASASALWCVVLVFCFLLASSWGRTHTDVLEFASYFHLVAWCVPALLTTVIVVFRLVEADELFGMCSVGQQSTDMLLSFHIVPAAIYLFVGVGFLLTCFWNAVGSRSPLKHTPPVAAVPAVAPAAANNYYQLRVRQSARVSTWRFVVFILLAFILPLSLTLVVHIYEYVQRDSWTRAGESSAPVAELLFVRAALQLLPSLACGFWLLSKDTYNAWRGLFDRMFCRGAPGKSSAENRASNGGAMSSNGNGCGALGAGIGPAVVQYVQLPVELSQTVTAGGGTNSVATMIGMQTLATQQTCASHSGTPSQSVGSGSRTFFADGPLQLPIAQPQSNGMLAHSLQHSQQLQMSPQQQLLYQQSQQLLVPHHQAALMQQQWAVSGQFSNDPSSRAPLLQQSTGDPSIKSGARTSSSSKRAAKRSEHQRLQQQQIQQQQQQQPHLYSAGAAAALMQQQQQQRVAVIAPTRGPLGSPGSPAECTSMSESYGACGVSIEPYTPPHCNTSNCSSSCTSDPEPDALSSPQPHGGAGGGPPGAGAAGAAAAGGKSETII